MSQTNQTFNGAFTNATCNNATNTTWALYSYSVALPTGFVAAPGARYWISIQAQTPSGNPVWGWRRGTTSNGVALHLFNGQVVTLTDRAFAMTP